MFFGLNVGLSSLSRVIGVISVTINKFFIVSNDNEFIVSNDNEFIVSQENSSFSVEFTDEFY